MSSPWLQLLSMPALVALTALTLSCGEVTLQSVERDAPALGEDASQAPQSPPLAASVVSTPPEALTVPTCKGPPYPIILAHGFTGFRDLGPLNYFNRVADSLRAAGEVVYEGEVAPYQSSTVRGQQLAAFVDEVLEAESACKVILIGHSQGGIDSRYAISTLGYGDRVSALVTVSTPHRGTKVTDAALGLIPGFTDPMWDFFARIIGNVISDVGDDPSLRAFCEQVSEKHMEQEFNPANPDDPRVAYFSVAGRSGLSMGLDECKGSVWGNPVQVDAVDPLLAATHEFLAGVSFDRNANDGLVTVESAKWGTFLGCVPGDHLDEIGQIADPKPLLDWDHVDMYRDVVDHLRAEGH